MLQSGIRVWITPQIGWAMCVGDACMSFGCVSLILAFHVLFALNGVAQGYSDVGMWKLMLYWWDASS